MQMQAKNPVEKAVEKLAYTWMECSSNDELRLIIWQINGDSLDIMSAFHAWQIEQPGANNIPDIFIKFVTAFETSYDYNKTLADELIQGYAKIAESTKQENPWHYQELVSGYSIQALSTIFNDFAQHHKDNMRYLNIIIQPEQITDNLAFNQWLYHLSTVVENNIRIIVPETKENPIWQATKLAKAPQIEVLSSEIDKLQVMQNTLAQTAGAGANKEQTKLRHLINDTFVLLEKGSAEQVEQRGTLALAIAKQHNWQEQVASIQNMIAGAWLKVGNIENAVKNYQDAQLASAKIEEPAAAQQLLVQSLFGEAGTWFAGQKYLKAAQIYEKAAKVAQEIPHFIFAIEAYRMAGCCMLQHKDKDMAMKFYALAIKIAEPLSKQECHQTSFAYVMQDLLNVFNEKSVKLLKQYADEYQENTKLILQKAEQAVKNLKHLPSEHDILLIDKQKDLMLEQNFTKLMQQREKVIQDAGANFINIIKIARHHLCSYFNGLPIIEHPLNADKTLAEWEAIPNIVEPDAQAVATFIQQHHSLQESLLL